MDFGKLQNISRVDFSLPVQSQRSLDVLKRSEKPRVPQVYFGAPVWSRKEWVGKLYPVGTRPDDYLKHYAKQLSAIELNTTFYRVPDYLTLAKWMRVTPENFKFCPKFFQGITHDESGLVASGRALHDFIDACQRLGSRLGISFLQLPPSFEPRELGSLARFLSQLPKGFPIAIEFRHPRWFTRERTLQPFLLDVLEQARAATVITDVAGRRDVSHSSLTTSRVHIRFVGNYLDPTDYTRIDAWVDRLKIWIDAGLQELYFFVHQPDDIHAPDLLSYFVQRMNQVCGLHLQDWRPEPSQMALF